MLVFFLLLKGLLRSVPSLLLMVRGLVSSQTLASKMVPMAGRLRSLVYAALGRLSGSFVHLLLITGSV